MTFAQIHEPYREATAASTAHAKRKKAVRAKPVEHFPLTDDPTMGAI